MGDARWRGGAMVIGATVCWGVMASLAKLLFRDAHVEPLQLVAVRSYLATLTLFLVLVATDRSLLRLGARDWGAAVLVGVGGLAANNFLYFQTIYFTTVATALLLQYQAPVLVALYAWLVHRDRLSPRLVLALVLALAGCALVVRVYDPAVLRPNLPGVLTGLGTACAFAFYILASRAAMRRVNGWTLLAYGYLACSAVWLVVAPPWRLIQAGYEPRVWLAFIAIATLGTALPFGLFVSGLRLLAATRTSILSMCEPAVAAVAAYFLLGETLLPLQMIGGGLILAAVLTVEAGGNGSAGASAA